MRHLISLAAGIALVGALLVCHGALVAEIKGFGHAHSAPHHHDGTAGHGDSTGTELGADCHVAAVVNGSGNVLAGPSLAGIVHAAMPHTQWVEAGLSSAAFNPSPPVLPPTLVQQHVLIRV
jgi:hypothetical protein